MTAIIIILFALQSMCSKCINILVYTHGKKVVNKEIDYSNTLKKQIFQYLLILCNFCDIY